MSLRWSNSLRLRVTPDSLCASLAQRWPRSRVLARASRVANLSFAPTGRGWVDAGAADPAQDLASALNDVLVELGETRKLAGSTLDVELADALVHLDVVEGEFLGNSERQLQSIALACVSELLGDAASDHEVRWQLQKGNRHLFIGAIWKKHIQGMVEAAARHQLRLRSIQPDFCLQWNLHAAALKPGSGVFAVASGDEAVVAHVVKGAVTSLSSGGWLDRVSAPGDATVLVKRLLCGLGLEPTATAGTLDNRVRRLLASVGQDDADQSSFVLVAPETSESALSSRWNVIQREPVQP